VRAYKLEAQFLSLFVKAAATPRLSGIVLCVRHDREARREDRQKLRRGAYTEAVQGLQSEFLSEFANIQGYACHRRTVVSSTTSSIRHAIHAHHAVRAVRVAGSSVDAGFYRLRPRCMGFTWSKELAPLKGGPRGQPAPAWTGQPI
jgi:hypothetical protein